MKSTVTDGSQTQAEGKATKLIDRLAGAHGLTMVSDQVAWMALDHLNLYRLFVTAVLAGMFFTPLFYDQLGTQALASARLITLGFLILAPVLFLMGRNFRRHPGTQAVAGLALDLIGLLTVMRLLGGVSSGIGTLLVASTLLQGVILPLRVSLLIAATAAIGILYASFADYVQGRIPFDHMTPAGLLGAAFFATTIAGFYLARRARETQALVQERSRELANLAQINELVIERMRTGVAIVDADGALHLMNDAAWYLAGMPEQRRGSLNRIAAALVDPLTEWRSERRQPRLPLQISAGIPAVLPRFADLANDQTLVFLEDYSAVSQQAHDMSLASLGKLSASIAHEIRNPLGAISHSAQLLGEADALAEPDQKLLDIILRHCRRMNQIIENVLQLARQRSAEPQSLNLARWLRQFADEYRQHQRLGEDRVELMGTDETLTARFDPDQMQQVLWNLCENARLHGRPATGPLTIFLDWGTGGPGLAPYVEVIDQGEGIPDADRGQLFLPFFTTSRRGTGLGLYLCKQLVDANHGRIRYMNDADGSRFRIELAWGSDFIGAYNRDFDLAEGQRG